MKKLLAVILLSLAAIPNLASAEEIRWYTNLDDAIQAAVQQRKPLMLHCWFDGCGPCKRLETYVFPNSDLAKAINESVIPVKVDVTIQREIASRYGIREVPQDVFVTPSGFVLLKRQSPADPKDYAKAVKGAYALYQYQDALATGSLNHKNIQNELAEFGGRAQQQVIGAGTEQGQSFVSNAATVVDQATGKISEQAVGILNQPVSYLNASSGDKYNTDDRFLPQPPTSFTNSTPPSSFQPQGGEGYRVTQQSPSGLPRSQYDLTPPPSRSESNGVVHNPFLRGNAPTAQAVSAPDLAAKAAAEASEPIASTQSTVQKQKDFAIPAPPQQPAPERVAKTNIEVPKSEIRTPEAGPALDGYCPVSLKNARQWIKGDARWGCYHRGKLFLFSSKENRDLFLTQPDRFSPALVGYDPVIYAESGQLLAGSRKIGVFYPAENPVIYVFASEASKAKFQANPEMFANTVRVATAECDQHRALR